MNKIPRFMKEYANYNIRTIKQNDLIEDSLKSEAIERINKSVALYEKGRMTIDETMRSIGNCFVF